MSENDQKAAGVDKFDETLKRLLKTPPKPHKKKVDTESEQDSSTHEDEGD